MTNMSADAAILEAVAWKTARPDEELDHRLQLLISSPMLAEVREWAGRRGVSASELIRQLIHEGLERLERLDEEQGDS